MSNSDNIGKMVLGIRFPKNTYKTVDYHELYMGVHVDQMGEIIEYDEKADTYLIEFPNNNWWYPAELINKQLKDK